jgi:hypothetical protein
MSLGLTLNSDSEIRQKRYSRCMASGVIAFICRVNKRRRGGGKRLVGMVVPCIYLHVNRLNRGTITLHT